MTTDTEIFMKEVRKIFPNITREKAFLTLKNGTPNFTWEYGEVNIKNSPKKIHKIIRRVNNMAKHYRKKGGFALKTMR